MHIHYLQHVPFEDLANIAIWAKEKGHHVSSTMFFHEGLLPSLDAFDWLIIMGGPMNIYEEDKYPWLREEKTFIKQAIASQKVVLGICLGAQLIADVLGAKVYKGRYKEIGWFPIKLTSEAKKTIVFRNFPDKFVAFHWHGDTFDIPSGAIRIAESEACPNQGFVYNERVVALQFHLESSHESINRLVKHCADELEDGRYIQTSEEMFDSENNFQTVNKLLQLLLENLEKISI